MTQANYQWKHIWSCTSLTVVINACTTRMNQVKRLEELADISCSALCCHSNETRAPIANPPNMEQVWQN